VFPRRRYLTCVLISVVYLAKAVAGKTVGPVVLPVDPSHNGKEIALFRLINVVRWIASDGYMRIETN